MSLVELISLAQRALLLCVWISLPVLAVAALVGLLLSVVQAATSVQDAALSHLPKFLAVSLALALTGPWMGRQLVQFALYTFGAR